MSTTIHFGLCLVFASMLSGCDAHPKAASSPRKGILALEFVPPVPPLKVTHFLHDTNNEEPNFFDGTFGRFNGTISVVSLSSNAAAWRVQIALNGSLSGSALHQTNEIEVSYPQGQQFALGQVGSVTGWYLSEKDFQDYENRLPK